MKDRFASLAAKLLATAIAGGIAFPTAASASSAFGDVSAHVQSTSEFVHIREEQAAQKSGATTLLNLDVRYSKSDFLVDQKGRCAVHGSRPEDPKPDVKVREGDSLSCMALESYLQYSAAGSSLAIGKRNIDLTQAMISSPANPLRVGLYQRSPFEPKEGVPLAEFKSSPNDALTVFAGTAFQEKAEFEMDVAHPHPYGGGSFLLKGWEFGLIGAKRFASSWVGTQLHPSLLVYAEGNRHGKGEHDALVGQNFSPEFIQMVLVTEYLRNSSGLAGKAGSDRAREARIKSVREGRKDEYSFPVPSMEKQPAWGATDFLGRDFLSIILYPAGGEDGFTGTSFVSLNDGSSRSSIGYEFKGPG